MLTISCKEAGEENCDYIAKGNTEQELMEDGFKHAKEAHGFTDEQI
jgi:predicted small metal-binding protein